MNFNYLGLKKLICTSYAGSPISHTELNDLPLFKKDEKLPYMIEITEVKDENGDGAEDLADIEFLLRNDQNTLTLLDGDGDFRSEECIEFLKEADIVVTNPPFSLFREYVAQLMEYQKKFLIIGNVNAVTYKEIFPLIKDDKLWFGYSIHSGDREFRVPDHYPLAAAGFRTDGSGRKYIRVKGVRWFTNIDYEQRHEDLILYKKYTPEEYPKYDNYDAINVDKTADIPCDYGGVMGVPITFLDKYNPDQFEIVAFRKGEDGKDLVFTREREFNRTFVSLYDGDSGDDKKCRRENQWKDYLCENNNTEIEPIDLFYPLSMRGCAEPYIDLAEIQRMNKQEYKSRQVKYNNHICQKTYHRLFIKRRQNEN